MTKNYTVPTIFFQTWNSQLCAYNSKMVGSGDIVVGKPETLSVLMKRFCKFCL